MKFIKKLLALMGIKPLEFIKKDKELKMTDLEDGIDALKRGDVKTALSKIKPLAEKGDSEAQYYMGVMYYKGKGVRRHYVNAYKWASRSAENGYEHSEILVDLVEEKMGTGQTERAQNK